ncbi:hypothetical protein [uncultured Limimaricola sp.]|uniref:GbsR/MarR family transcriptional regulator n=1 Tax=uncultured Limimaricola sp. TaxID=2211667 RepID=UPI0030F5B513
MDHGGSNLSALRIDFVERLGVLAQSEGATRNAGRQFALLAFEGRPMMASEIMQMLQLGRSSVGTSARFLEDRGMVRRVARLGERQDRFELTPTVLTALSKWLASRRMAAGAEFETIIPALPEAANDTRHRLAEHARFHRAVEAAISSAQDGARHP